MARSSWLPTVKTTKSFWHERWELNSTHNPMACFVLMWMLLVTMEASGESNGTKELKLEVKSNFSMLTSNDTWSMAKPLLRGRKDSPEVLGNSSTRSGPRDAICASACPANSGAWGCSQDGVCMCFRKGTSLWTSSVQVLEGRGCGSGNSGLSESCPSLCKFRNYPWYTCDATGDCTCSLYAPTTTSTRC
eukprot:Skav202069  [mRNA]  locus=scaffold1138:737691:738260:- [translate_table: standard]